MKSGRIELPEKDEAIRIFFLDKCAICHPLMFARHSIFKASGLKYDPAAFASEDYDLWTRLVATAKFGNVQEVLLQYRITEGQMSFKYFDAQQKNSTRCKARMLSYVHNAKDEKEERAMEIIVNHQSVDQMDQLKDCMTLLGVIGRANENRKFFDTGLFRQYLSDKRKSLVLFYYHNTKQYTINNIIELFSAPGIIRQQITLAGQTKIILKSLIFFKNKLS
jgi:hypothetical protein